MASPAAKPAPCIAAPNCVTSEDIQCRLAVIWIDWYAYHLARLHALANHASLRDRVIGIELVGAAGVHGNLVFRASERDGLPIATLLPDSNWSDAAQTQLSRLLWSKLTQVDPEAVLVPGYYTLPAFVAAIWARIHRKKAILMTESTRGDHRRNRLLEFVKGAVLTRLFHAAISGGKRQAAYLKDLGFTSENVAGLYDVVGNDYFAQESVYYRERRDRREWNLPENYFLFVGRLAPEKNVGGLIQAYARYRRRGGSLSLVVVGDGPEASPLRQQVVAEGLAKSVLFTGLKDTRDIVPYYAFADWFVLPSWLDPWGLVVNEAMASGLPLIVSDRCGCCDDLVEHGENGYTFNPEREDSLAEALLKTQEVTAQQRNAMARRSMEIICRYSPELWAEEVVRIANLTQT